MVRFPTMILGIHLASDPYSIGIITPDNRSIEVSVSPSIAFNENLIDEIDAVAGKINLNSKQVTAIGVTHGPGSYTGIRIGITVAKTLAQVLNIPIYPISTLEAMMLGVRHIRGLYLPTLPARKGEANAALFACSNGQIKRLSEDFSWTTERMHTMLGRIRGPITVLDASSQVSGLRLALWAKDKLASGEKGSYKAVRPVYSHEPNIGTRKE